MSKAISRALLGKIVDEVFDGAIEDTKVIEEIYAVIKREEAAPSAAEPIGYRWTFDGGVTWHYGKDNPGPFRFGNADEIQPLYAAPPAPSVAVDIAAIALLNAIVDAWEALSGGRQVRNSDIEAWLGKHMAPAINAIRAFLNRPRPEGA